MRRRALILAAGLVLGSGAAAGRNAGDPIVLAWEEGDVGGMSTIYDPEDDEPIGFVEYHQTRRGDLLSAVRVARFRDGSRDEDVVQARVSGNRLEAVGGRSVIHDADGETLVDLRIDMEGARLTAVWGRGGSRRRIERAQRLPAGTYWGPLVFIVLKNFAANEEGGRVAFRTVAPTPRPRVLDMEFVRVSAETVERTGIRVEAERFELRPTVHWLVDPVIRMIAPRATFRVLAGQPPALVRFDGPRNYRGQRIRIQ